MSITDDLFSVGSKAARVPINAVDTALDVTNVALNTTRDTAQILGNTTTGVTENVGQAATSATGIAANTLQTFETVSGRISNSTEEMAKRRAEIEKSKTAKQQGKTKEEIAQIEADTEVMLKQIDDEFNQKKLVMEKEQEMLLERLNTKYDLAGLAQKENEDKIAECYYYGFKREYSPYEPGKNKTSIYYSYDKAWYYSYVPMSFVSDSGQFIVFEFSKKPLGEIRQEILEGVDKNTGKELMLKFELQQKKGYIRNTQQITPVVEIEGNKESGKLYFKKVWFFEKKESVGGRRSRKYSRKSKNKRRNTKRRTHRKKKSTRKKYKYNV